MARSTERFEVRWPVGAILAELQAEADARQVNLQQHLWDLIVARHRARHGDTALADLLWTPGAPAASPAASEPEDPAAASAAAAAAAWGELL